MSERLVNEAAIEANVHVYRIPVDMSREDLQKHLKIQRESLPRISPEEFWKRSMSLDKK